jgi:hypothetical protein
MTASFFLDCELDDGIELSHEGDAIVLFALPGQQRVRVDAYSDVVESQMADEAYVVGGREGAQALDGVVA